MSCADESPSIVLRFQVRGRVQGVGFRYFVLQTAQEIGIAGWVKNLRDGRVEALAEGPESKVRRFELALRAGPPLSRVDEVLELAAPHEGAARFEIRY
jgi:acylphosphatase